MAFLYDAAERALKTFVQAFVAVYAAVPLDLNTLTDLSVLQKAALAGAAAVLSLASSVISRLRGDRDSASAL